MVRTWISTRFQADLDYLGLGLKGGKADPSTVGVGTIFLPTSAGVTGGAGPVNTVAGGAAATTTGTT